MEIKKTSKKLSQYKGEFFLGVPNGKGVFTFSNNFEFDGYFINGLPHSVGKLTFPNKHYLIGEFKQGSFTGNGTVYSENGQPLYEWKNGVRVASTKPGAIKNFEQVLADQIDYEKIYKDRYKKMFTITRFNNLPLNYNQDINSYYQGELENNHFVVGLLFCPNGDIYFGEFQNNIYHGKGTLFKADTKQLFMCDFLYGEPNGYCKIYEPDTSYAGMFLNGKRNGEGVQTYADGTVYHGMWFNDQKHGRGILKQHPIKYEGNWFFNQKHGEFKVSTGDKTVTKKYFRNFDISNIEPNPHQKMQDSPIAFRPFENRLVYENGVIYDGEILNNQKHGFGKLYYETNKLMYEGNFALDKFNGNGNLYDLDGNLIYSGNFVFGQKHGFGTEDVGTEVYFGQFKFGLRHGNGVILKYNDDLSVALFPCVFNKGKFVRYDKKALKVVDENLLSKYYIDTPAEIPCFNTPDTPNMKSTPDTLNKKENCTKDFFEF